jgi:hypothetical protein
MPSPVKRLNVNNIKNNISSKGLSPDRLIAYLIMFSVGYIAMIISKNLGIGLSYWVASIGFPVLFVWYLLFILKYENQPYFQLIAPFINFNGFGNQRKRVGQSSIEIVEDSILINKNNNSYIGLIRVYPKNIFTLKEDDRILLTQRYATEFLNNIRGKRFELVLRNRTATVSDYKDYFDYYIDYPEQDMNKLTDLTKDHLKTHLFEFEAEINKGYLKFKELYLEVYLYAGIDSEEDIYDISQEISSFQTLLKNIDINTMRLDRKDTEEYLQKFVLFKSTEELSALSPVNNINHQ